MKNFQKGIINKVRKITLITFLFLFLSPLVNSEVMENPFFTEYETNFKIPPFSQINEDHFMPAFIKGMELHNEEINDIIENKEEPSFENIIVAMERSGSLLSRVSAVFFNLSGSTTNPKIQEIEKEISPKLSSHYDSISLNPEIFKKVKILWENIDSFDLSLEERKILEETYKRFIRSGALLEGSDKKRYAEINQDITKLSVQFSQNLLAETNDFEIILDKEDLSGLTDDIIDLAKLEAENKFSKNKDDKYKDKYVFTVQRSSMYPFLTYSTRRDLREKLYKGYIQRGDNNNEYDNKDITSKIASLRVEKANILGFESHAHYVLDNTMAKTPEAVYGLLNQLWAPALKRAKNELREMQILANEEGNNFEIASWDWWHYAEKVRKDKYDLDEEEIKEYFTLDNTIDGIFKTSNKLFGLTFEEKFDLDLYHPDARVWEVKDKDGSHIGFTLAIIIRVQVKEAELG